MPYAEGEFTEMELEQARANHDMYIKVYVFMLEEGCSNKAADVQAKEAVMHMARYMA